MLRCSVFTYFLNRFYSQQKMCWHKEPISVSSQVETITSFNLISCLHSKQTVTNCKHFKILHVTWVHRSIYVQNKDLQTEEAVSKFSEDSVKFHHFLTEDLNRYCIMTWRYWTESESNIMNKITNVLCTRRSYHIKNLFTENYLYIRKLFMYIRKLLIERTRL